MLKTVYKFLELMKAQRRKLYLSFLFNFLDGIFIMIPLVIAYYMVASIPELNKNAARELDEKLLVLCIAAMAVTIICRIILDMLPCVYVQEPRMRLYVRSGSL